MLAWAVVVFFLLLVAVPVAVAVLAKGATRRSHDAKSRPTGRADSKRVVPMPKSRESRPTAEQSGLASPLAWYGPGSLLKVAGFTLRDPLVYASANPSQRSNWATDPSEILLHAEVRRPRGALADMGYWPWYSRLEPEHRYCYLEWLASGKQSLPRYEGFLFLYYYGLERRRLVDEADRDWVLREVLRLRKLDAPRCGTRDGASFRRYTSALLWFEVAVAPELTSETSFSAVCSLTDQWTESTLTPALAWVARHGKPLPADLAIRVAHANPESVQSVIRKRLPDEFDALFAKRYAEKFDAGLQLRVSKRPRQHAYRPASGGLSEVSCTVADPMGIPSQFKPLAEIWNSCVNDLRKLSKVGAAAHSDELTVEVWESMPPELRQGVDHPLAADVHSMVLEGSKGGGECIVPASRLVSLLQLEKRAKLTPTQSRRLAETVEHTGYSIEPDARTTGRTYGWNEPVAVFLRTEETPVDPGRFIAAACILQLGLAIAEADGEIDENELRQLTEGVESSFQLPDHERRRLEALRAVLIKSGADIGPIARKIEHALSPPARQSVGRLLVAIAAADGSIDRSEEAALRKCYRALGLGPEVLEQTISELAPLADDAMVTVQAGFAPAARGEAIPAPTPARLQLNREAISAIMAETREVARLLADAMKVDEEPRDEMEAAFEPAAEESAVATLVEPTSGPAGRYAQFYQAIIDRDRWTRADVDALARSHGLMLSGALEAVNDWAFEMFGRPLIDEVGDEFTVDRTLL